MATEETLVTLKGRKLKMNSWGPRPVPKSSTWPVIFFLLFARFWSVMILKNSNRYIIFVEGFLAAPRQSFSKCAHCNSPRGELFHAANASKEKCCFPSVVNQRNPEETSASLMAACDRWISSLPMSSSFSLRHLNYWHTAWALEYNICFEWIIFFTGLYSLLEACL